MHNEEMIKNRMCEVYEKKVDNFFTKIEKSGFSNTELKAVPSLFLPGWGEEYGGMKLKIAIVGKETLRWATAHGDNLYDNVIAHKNDSYDVTSSCSVFRDEGPAAWQNNFWQYAISALSKIFSVSKDDVMSEKNRLLKSFVWFNSHSIETYDSKAVNHRDISKERMAQIQKISDECGLNDFKDFIDVFCPDVILYFYRNSSEIPDRIIPSTFKLRDKWGEHEDIFEYYDGRTLLLQLRHPTYNVNNGITEDYIAEVADKIMYTRNVKEIARIYDIYNMTATEWRWWVDYTRNAAVNGRNDDLNVLARNLIRDIACELLTRNSRMTAQTLVLILNEVDLFRSCNWVYSSERRGPCRVVAGAYNASDEEDSAVIACAITKLNGELAWK